MKELHKAAHLYAGEHHARMAKLHKARVDFHKGWLEAHQPEDDDEQGQCMAELHKTLGAHHDAMHKEHVASAEFHAEMAKGFMRVPADDDADKSATIDTLAKAVLRQIGNQIRPDGIHGIVPQDPGIRPVMRAGQRPLDSVTSTIKPDSAVDLRFEKLFNVEL